MSANPTNDELEQLIANLSRSWKDPRDQILLAGMIRALDTRYSLSRKMASERGVEGILAQMLGRLANSFGRLSVVQGKRILDIACGSNTSKAPASLYINTPSAK